MTNQTPDELTKRIEEARKRAGQDDVPAPENGDDKSSMSGINAATEIVGGTVAGVFLGYWADRWLGTAPWMMIVFIFAGFGAGIWNIYRATVGGDFGVGFAEDKKDGKE